MSEPDKPNMVHRAVQLFDITNIERDQEVKVIFICVQAIESLETINARQRVVDYLRVRVVGP